MPKKKAVTGSVEEKINATYGEGTIARLGGKGSKTEVMAVPTELPSVDEATGVGGIPAGRMIELFAPESMGKTTLAAWIVKKHLEYIPKKKAAFLDVEHALDPEWISKVTGINFDSDSIYVCQPDYGEQALDIAQMLVKSGEYSIVVLDSTASLIPKAELDGNFGDAKMAERARLLSKACPQFAAQCSKSNTTMIWINQIRTKIGVFFGDPTTTPGGMSLKFYCSIRMRLGPAKGSNIKVTKSGIEEVVARKMTLNIIKNKVGPPFRKATIYFDFEHGIDQARDLVESGINSGVIKIKTSKKLGAGCAFFGKYNLGKHDKNMLKINRSAIKKHAEEILEAINGNK